MAERKAFLLRIDPEVWAELEAWAQAELRSVNGQIEFLLRDAIQRRRGRARRPGSISAGSTDPGGSPGAPGPSGPGQPGDPPA